MFRFFYQRPYLLFSIIGAFFFIGVVALVKLPKNLFPDANRPQVVVITQVPGATAQVAANSVSKPIEEEIARISLLREVSSVNVANFSIVKAEFEYAKGLEAAAVDVANSLAIARAKLPKNASPAIYTAGDFTLPVDVIALRPKEGSGLSLTEVRKIADSFLKPALLADPVIGNVEVFGGYGSAIEIHVDPFKAKRLGVDLALLARTVGALDRDLPLGFLKGEKGFYTLTYYGEKKSVEALAALPLKPGVKLGDVATLSWSHKARTSGYFGNGHEAIALSVQRAPGGSVLAVSDAARAHMKELAARYPAIDFSIADTQRNLIETANANMLEALRDAIVFTLLVILLFLGNFRALIAAGLSIPMVFFATMAIIWLGGGELNIVIYTGIILALGMLVDDAVVVLENIERHLESGEALQNAIERGTEEVVRPIFAGTVATIVVIFPLMFVGDYPQHIFRPLMETLIVALLVSYFLAITFIPRLSLWLYRNGAEKSAVERWFEGLYEKSIGRLVGPYLSILRFSDGSPLKPLRRMALIAGAMVVLVVSLKNIMPTIGKDVMPPMDTGIIKAQIAFSANETTDEAQRRLAPFLAWLHEQPWAVSSSVAFGTEPGVLSLGGNLPTEATLTINAVDRFHRKATIWELEDIIRDRLAKLRGLKRLDVFDFGATALSTIKAPLDTRLRSADWQRLPEAAESVLKAFRPIAGLTSLHTSWDNDFTEIEVRIDTERALRYGLTPESIAAQLPIQERVVTLTSGLDSMNTQPVRLYLAADYTRSIESLRLLPIDTPRGPVPLAEVAELRTRFTPARIERDGMLYSLDVGGYRAKRPITHITDDAEAALQKLDLPGILLSQEGDIAQLNDSFQRMIKAIALGIALLLLTLVAIYRSVRLSLIMIFVLPLSMIGAAWGMLLFNKPSCMPSMVGVLLLFGIIIKNAILLIDFYQEYEAEGQSPFEAALQSVRVRFRPVMMTAFATIAGMIPIALEWAVGLERLSPLADVAIGGLLVGTLLTLVYVPMLAYATERGKK
ncbi:efflux RND transporter permease subunit [Hydrogenimonas sp.]